MAASVCGTIEAERFCGLEVDGEHEFFRLLHRQVGRLFAFEDALDSFTPRSHPAQ